MAEATAPSTTTRAQRQAGVLSSAVTWALLFVLGLLLVAHTVFLAVHAVHLLAYPYPLDYGEGPLLAQVNLLRSGVPLWRLYADPEAPPYAVVNYPPVYHAAAAVFAFLPGNALLAGRLLALAATCGTIAALWALTWSSAGSQRSPQRTPARTLIGGRILVGLAFLALPIVREWSVLMRVDLPGVCLGLWGLVIVQRSADKRQALWAVPLLVLSLYTKPSLIAAPAAAVAWLLLRDWRQAARLAAILGLSGAIAFALFQAGSGGWFGVHVLAANANDWQVALARKFWNDQLRIHWPLPVAATLAVLLQDGARRRAAPAGAPTWLLPVFYTLFGALAAVGVGKVGAYANYFLEFYAGLIWLATLGMMGGDRLPAERPNRWAVIGGHWLVIMLVSAGLLRYYPLWSENYLKLAGIIEGKNPPRIVFGGYSVWRDLQRERAILATLGRVNAALVDEVRAAAGPIFTDVPGVAAQASQPARLQAFEHRQLLDAGHWDQRGLLVDMANGQVPLVVLDYLGNWLTPQMITLITHRYGQDGSRGTYDLYRPINPGPRISLDRAFPGLRLSGYHLVPSPGRPAYHAGETVVLTLEWQRLATGAPPLPAGAGRGVVVQLIDANGQIVLETVRPLLYGALPPEDWPANQDIQHMQPLALPPDLPPRTYALAVTLRAGERDLAPPHVMTQITVEEQAGRMVGEQGYYVPAPLFTAWQQMGGDESPGDALTPAMPFNGFTEQCFVRECLRMRGAAVERLPLGELIALGDVAATTAATPAGLSGPFLDFWRAHGGEAVLGPPITGEILRNGRIVQYTRYARLERAVDGDEVRRAPLGEEFLRLPGGVAYRWP